MAIVVPACSCHDCLMNTLDRYFNQLAEAGRAAVERRLQIGMSQAALASAAGVDAKTLRSLERGERWPQDTSRVKIERALGWQDGTLHALLVGDFLWRELDNSDGTRSGGIIYLRAPSESSPSMDLPVRDDRDHPRPDADPTASTLTVSELAALLVTRSQSLERRVRELEEERDELRALFASEQPRRNQRHDHDDATSLDRDAQRDGLTEGTDVRGRGIRARSSERRPRLLDDNDVDDILELPHAADDSEDPGEDDD